MLFTLVLSMVLGSGVVVNEPIDSGLSYEQCVDKSFKLQDIADEEIASGDYDVIATKAFCVWYREKRHE